MRLALDHHYSRVIAEVLRERGHDVVAVAERGWQTLPDDAVLASCCEDGRALLTNNVADFAVLVREWQAQGRGHAGLVFTSDASMPRSKATIGRYVETLDRLLSTHPGEAALTDRVVWLTADSDGE